MVGVGEPEKHEGEIEIIDAENLKRREEIGAKKLTRQNTRDKIDGTK